MQTPQCTLSSVRYHTHEYAHPPAPILINAFIHTYYIVFRLRLKTYHEREEVVTDIGHLPLHIDIMNVPVWSSAQPEIDPIKPWGM